MNIDPALLELSDRVARLEVGQDYIKAILTAVAVPIYFQFINTLARKFKGRDSK